MKVSTLEVLAPLLNALRAHPALKEGKPGEIFLKDGRGLLHFHESPRGIFADVLLAEGRVHMRVSTHAEQAELLERIDPVLKSLVLRERKRHRRRERVRREP